MRYRFAILLTLLLAPSALAENYQAGDSIVVITKQAPIKRKSEIVSNARLVQGLKVQKVDGDWLEVFNKTRGWIHKKDVIPQAEAFEYVLRRAEEVPDDLDWRHARAIVRHREGDIDAALTDYSSIIDNDTTRWRVYYNRALVWRKKREYDKAIADLNRALQLKPEDALIYYRRGSNWADKGYNYEKAISDYDHAIRLDPDYGDAYASRALAWQILNDDDKALQDYNEALRIDPKLLMAYNNRGNIWKSKGDIEKMNRDFSKAIEIDPTYATAYWSRGNAAQEQGDFITAIHDYKQFIRLRPQSLDLHHTIAWIRATNPHDNFRDGTEAVEYALKACELAGDEDPYYLNTLAAAYAENGEFDKAVSTQDKAIGLLRPWDYSSGEAPGLTSTSDLPDYRSRLELYRQRKAYRDKPDRR